MVVLLVLLGVHQMRVEVEDCLFPIRVRIPGYPLRVLESVVLVGFQWKREPTPNRCSDKLRPTCGLCKCSQMILKPVKGLLAY